MMTDERLILAMLTKTKMMVSGRLKLKKFMVRPIAEAENWERK
jgi:hypothetical protein